MSTEFLNLSVEVINAAIQTKDFDTARDTLEKMEIAGLKDDAASLRKVIQGQLSPSSAKAHVSKRERNLKRRTSWLYRKPHLSQLMVHPSGGNPSLKERLPSVDMLWARSPSASKKLYHYHFSSDEEQTQLIVHPDGGSPRMKERLPSVEMLLAR